MNVGICKVTLRIPENHSLKGKRRVINSLCDRVRHRFNVSIAEVDDNDVWQIATLGISCVSNHSRHAGEVLNNVVAYIESIKEDVELLDYEQETISGF